MSWLKVDDIEAAEVEKQSELEKGKLLSVGSDVSTSGVANHSANDLVSVGMSRSTGNEAHKSIQSIFLKLDELFNESNNSSTVSFSSSKGMREANLHQIQISQRGIQIHKQREKGIFDFSYYPKFDFWKDIEKIFSTGFKEYRFTFLFGSFQFVGSIDFVSFGKDRILIVDYKSGKSTHNDLYKQQLIFYAQCLCHIKNLGTSIAFDLVLDYVDQKKVEHFVYKSVNSSEYFDTFLSRRELDRI